MLISKHLYLGHIIDWAHEMGCIDDHRVIANCLDFIDPEAYQLNISNLSQRLFTYQLYFIL